MMRTGRDPWLVVPSLVSAAVSPNKSYLGDSTPTTGRSESNDGEEIGRARPRPVLLVGSPLLLDNAQPTCAPVRREPSVGWYRSLSGL